MKNRVVAGIGAACFVAGLLVGWQAIPKAEDTAQGQTPGATSSGNADRLSGSHANANLPRDDSSREEAERSSSARIPSVDDILRLTVTNSHTKSYQNLSARLDGLNAGQFQKLIAEMGDIRNNPQAQAALGVVFEKFGELAPREALAFVQDPSNQRLPIWNAIGAAATAMVTDAPDEALEAFLKIKGNYRQSALHSLFNAASTANPDLIPQWFAHPELKKALRNQHSSWVIRNAVEKWAVSDPMAAASFAASTPNGSQKQEMTRAIAGAWARQDPTAAVAWAAGLESASLRRAARGSLATALAGEDPKAALDLLDSAPSESERRQLLSAISGGWAQHDMEAVHGWLLELDDPRDLAAAIGGCTHQIGKDPERFLDLIDKVPSEKKANISSNIVSQWAQHDSDAAVAWVQALEDGPRKTSTLQSLISQLAYNNAAVAAELLDGLESVPSSLQHVAQNIGSSWAQHDPDAARAWAENIEDKKMRSRAIQGVVSNWANHEPEQAATYVLENLKGSERKNLISSTVSQWMHHDESAAAAWVRSLPGDDRLSASGSFVQALINRGSVEAALEEFVSLVEEFPDALSKNRLGNAPSSLVAKIAVDDPARAMGIFDQLPEGSSRADAAGAIARTWLNSDSLAASEWVGGLPEGPVRDAGAIQVISNILQSDSEGAFIWATSLSKKNQRMEYTRKAIMSLAESDPAAARASVANSGLPEAEQVKLLEKIE